MKGFVIAEAGHVVNCGPPIDINGAGLAGDVFSMEEYAHASIIIQLGVTGAATTLTVEACDDFVPTTHPAIAFSYYIEDTDSGDILGARTAVTTAGIALSTNDNVFYVIELDASELPDGYPCVRVALSDPSAATLANICVILSGSRYGEVESPTAIA